MSSKNRSSSGGGVNNRSNEGAEDGMIDRAILEKRLEQLRDTQESVQTLSLWCLAHKKQSTAIIDTWLRVLRKSPVEKRLTMFYLANDIVQHARRQGNATLVNQWAVAVQKATPHVRTPSSISSAISRIFKIWEERAIYSKDAVADLLSLLSKQPGSGREKGDKPSRKPETYTACNDKINSFQPNILISKAKQAFRLKSHLGVTFYTKKFVNTNIEQLIGSIKDRQHGMEVVDEITSLLEKCRSSESKLLTEVEERRKIVEVAEVGIVYYEKVRVEAGTVNKAYKDFMYRVMSTKERVDEKMRAFDEMENMDAPSSAPAVDRSAQHPYPGSSTKKIPFDLLQSLDMETLQSIKLPPNRRPTPPIPSDDLHERPPDDVPWTNTTHSHMTSQSIKSLVSSSSSSNLPSSTPELGYSTSTMAGMSDSSIQQMAQAQMLPDLHQTPTTWSQTTWATENSYNYQNYMTSQYPVAQQSVAPTLRSSPNFTITPSMQLQMQLQQQQQNYGAMGYPTPPVPSASTLPDLSSIPLPPGPNPPLPDDKTLTNNFGHPYGAGAPPDWMEAQAQQQQQSTGNDDYDHSQQQYNSQRYHPYNNNQQRPSNRGGGWPRNPHPSALRSPNPGFSPRNSNLGMGTMVTPPRSGSGDRFGTPSSGYITKGGSDGEGMSATASTEADSGRLSISPETGTHPSSDYGYSMSYTEVGSEGTGLNGNDDGTVAPSAGAYNQYQQNPPFQNNYNSGGGFAEGGRPPMHRGRARGGFGVGGGRGFRFMGRGSPGPTGGFRGRGMRGPRRGF